MVNGATRGFVCGLEREVRGVPRKEGNGYTWRGISVLAVPSAAAVKSLVHMQQNSIFSSPKGIVKVGCIVKLILDSFQGLFIYQTCQGVNHQDISFLLLDVSGVQEQAIGGLDFELCSLSDEENIALVHVVRFAVCLDLAVTLSCEQDAGTVDST